MTKENEFTKTFEEWYEDWFKKPFPTDEEEAEELLRAIWCCFDNYELCRILREKHFEGAEMCRKLDSHFDFDDSE